MSERITRLLWQRYRDRKCGRRAYWRHGFEADILYKRRFQPWATGVNEVIRANPRSNGLRAQVDTGGLGDGDTGGRFVAGAWTVPEDAVFVPDTANGSSRNEV